MYFIPACFANFAHALAANGFGLKALASCWYSATGMPSSSIAHSCRPRTLYKPKWTNMPKRASCHHFMRRSRSATVDVVGPDFSACANKETGRAAEAAVTPRVPKRARREGLKLDCMIFLQLKRLSSNSKLSRIGPYRAAEKGRVEYFGICGRNSCWITKKKFHGLRH